MAFDGSRPAAPRASPRGAATSRGCPSGPISSTRRLAENLRLGAPDASDEDLHRVLEAVGLADLLANLPAGL